MAWREPLDRSPQGLEGSRNRLLALGKAFQMSARCRNWKFSSHPMLESRHDWKDAHLRAGHVKSKQSSAVVPRNGFTAGPVCVPTVANARQD